MHPPLFHTLRSTVAAALLLSATVVTTLAHQGHSIAPSASPVASTGAWEVVDERQLDIDGELIALSPDGQWIAGVGPDRTFCIWEVETGDPTCDRERNAIDPKSIVWAPDSTAVAWSLDAHLRLYDSDLFVFELDKGQSTNLTDDSYEGDWAFGADAPDELPVDVYPGWSADSQSLVFARSNVLAASESTEIVAIDRAGGEVTPLHTAHTTMYLAIASSIRLLDDGTILYAINTPDPNDDLLGIWRLDPDGAAMHLMPGGQDEAFPIPALIDVRPTASGYVASGYSWRLAGGPLAGQSIAFELDVTTGEVSPLGGGGTVVMPYRYAPDGSGKVAAVRTGDAWRVVVADLAGQESDLGLEIIPSPWITTHGIAWAENNTLLMHTSGRFGATIVTIAASP